MDKRALGMAFRGSARRCTIPGASDISRSVGGISFGRDQSKDVHHGDSQLFAWAPSPPTSEREQLKMRAHAAGAGMG
jgi:hypothetical protein